jgi:hypothetical protein
MTYTALAVVFLLGAVLIGCRSASIDRPWLAAACAAVMVAAQFALLMWS